MMKKTTTKNALNSAKRIVIKIGSQLIRDEADHVKRDWFDAFAKDIAKLQNQGKEILIVSSGAVALGRQSLGISLSTPPSKIPLPQKQAASAIGQFYLFAAYHEAFNAQDLKAAQVLLTIGETENRRMYLNAREAVNTLLEKNIIPIMNENDVISTGELRFGDNDRLAVRVAQMVDADLVILLSTADGLYTENPQTNPDATHISIVERITDEHIQMAGDAIPGLSTGGMKSKIDAARSATSAGIHMIISDGMAVHALGHLSTDDTKRATIFLAAEKRQNARKTWIGAHLNPKGKIIIDTGAEEALKRGASLLPVGVVRIEGDFERGDAVRIYNVSDIEIAMGLTAYNSGEAGLMIGYDKAKVHTLQGYEGRDELVHRNDLVLIDLPA